VHLRRALILFAIVLGLAAVAASVSRPGEEADPLPEPSPTTAEQSPTATPAPAGGPEAADLTFVPGDRSPQRIRAGQAATVSVQVDEPGQVEIAGLGVSSPAEPLTPARFEVLTSATGRHAIMFTAAGSEGEAVRVGTLSVVPEDG
jgi:hypothetical protein